MPKQPYCASVPPLLLLLLALLVSVNAQASGVIDYEIYKAREDGSRSLLERGTSRHDTADLVQWGNQVSLPVTAGYRISAPVKAESEFIGFGMQLHRESSPLLGMLVFNWPPGFSWEWFDHEADAVFKKRQRGGYAEVRFVEVPGGARIAGLRILEDVVFRHQVFGLSSTREVVIKRGRVLDLCVNCGGTRPRVLGPPWLIILGGFVALLAQRLLLARMQRAVEALPIESPQAYAALGAAGARPFRGSWLSVIVFQYALLGRDVIQPPSPTAAAQRPWIRVASAILFVALVVAAAGMTGGYLRFP